MVTRSLSSILDELAAGNASEKVFSLEELKKFVSEASAQHHNAGPGTTTLLYSGIAPTGLDGAGGNDALNAGAGADTLLGGEGNDALVGGAGSDSMAGGGGNDTYYVDDAGDVVSELGGDGVDTVYTSVDFVASDGVENMRAWNTTQGLALIGNDLNNAFIGGEGGDFLDGAAGNDALNGGAGADTLIGADGNDALVGGVGADSMAGGHGNDTYYVDDAGDLVGEVDGSGVDTVYTSVDFMAGAGIENLRAWNPLGGLALTGNDLANAMIGGAGDDTLEGGAGNDQLNGGLGDDTYIFGRGDGVDLMADNDGSAANNDVLQMGADIASDQLWFRRSGSDLEVSIIGTGDRARISGWYVGDAHQIETIVAGDGKVLDQAGVQALVEAMAGFAPPPAGQTQLAPELATQLAPTLAASWQ